MTTRETKLIALSAAAGILTGVLVLALLGERGKHFFADAPAVAAAQPASAGQPLASPASALGTQPGATVELSPAEITAAGVQVAEVRTASLKTDIDAFGRVEQPEAQLAAVSARIGGRVDKLYVQYTGERVRSGQPVADLYSPEVATAIEEYRLAEENRNGLHQSDDNFARTQADALVTASQHKLELWGISSKQIDAPEKEGVPHVTIYSYASGTVVDRKVTQGQYVNAGDTLFTVADLSQVWIKADVYEEQLPQIHQGQEVEITAESLPNKTLHGHVDFIEPAANQQTRTVPVHVHVANPGMRLLPGMFVNATFVSRAALPTIVIPRSAVLDSGMRKIVYLAGPMASLRHARFRWVRLPRICIQSPVAWRLATRLFSTATSSLTRKRTSAPACPGSTVDRKSSAAKRKGKVQPRPRREKTRGQAQRGWSFMRTPIR